ncbi:MAG: hypothetical protein C5B50_20580 [Verrucomicrobia bacterium]|nr:MAG: hypothetical protein C5B50_20580 [Verrucomicrobiota bacterium]
MNVKGILFSVGVILGALGIPNARAQPGGGYTYVSLEARIIQSPIVFLGTIRNVSETIIHTNNQWARQGKDAIFPVSAFDMHNYEVTLVVDEVLKGNVSRRPIHFQLDGVAEWKDLHNWADRHASFLFFPKNSLDDVGSGFFALMNFVYLSQASPGRGEDEGFTKFGRIYGMDMTFLTNREDILRRARAFAKERHKAPRFHNFRLPELSSQDHFFATCSLTVPVGPALEETAKHLIARPDDFISGKDSPRAAVWRCDLRADGVSALRYFKSAKNIKLLKSLLEAPDYWISNGPQNVEYKVYSVRETAAAVLKTWGVNGRKRELRREFEVFLNGLKLKAELPLEFRVGKPVVVAVWLTNSSQSEVSWIESRGEDVLNPVLEQAMPDGWRTIKPKAPIQPTRFRLVTRQLGPGQSYSWPVVLHYWFELPTGIYRLSLSAGFACHKSEVVTLKLQEMEFEIKD